MSIYVFCPKNSQYIYFADGYFLKIYKSSEDNLKSNIINVYNNRECVFKKTTLFQANSVLFLKDRSLVLITNGKGGLYVYNT